ncbi:xaa-Pro aminopeptidase 1-like isoform X1 [Asterias amurensis]|uniref:xaa-Pro aminopeptidase 1-like isoform X1 n=1 Tax=Asterias amurensis TaxID=7602 RepID=UPI003AB1E6CE
MLRILLVFGFMLTAGLLDVTADPIASLRDDKLADKPCCPECCVHDRRKRQAMSEDVRNCAIDPPFYPPTVTDTSARLSALRNKMTDNNIAAYIIPSEDAHGSEYVAARDMRRAFICGLKGSAGLAVVTMTEAKLWTDGRYFLQAEKEMDCNWDLMKIGGGSTDPSASAYLATTLADGDVVGFDPALMSVSDFQAYEAALKEQSPSKMINMTSISTNLVDEIWDDQPSYNSETVITVLDAAKYTGETWQQKIIDGAPGQDSVRKQLQDMTAETVDGLVINKLDEIAWLFNIRGDDIPYNPMIVSYAIVTMTEQILYLYDSTSTKRVPDEVKTHLNFDSGSNACTSSPCVIIKDYDMFFTDLANMSAAISGKMLVSDAASYAIYDVVGDKRYVTASPLLLMKAVKSETEALGMEEAHAMDSVALCNLGAWMQKTIDGLEDPMVGDKSVISEQIVMQKAIEFRAAFEDNRGLSFGTIAGFGPHGAIIHYTSTPETDVAITKGSTFLLDSGGQYLQGTCDITRTFHFGTPTDFQREAYTRVLLGSIDLVMAVFRDGIYGRDIEVYARGNLWQGGLDYNHGTGHGIGHYLNVHEGPARIRIGVRQGEKPLQTNMFQSDEPGYYEDGSFGIRIENVMRSIPATVEHDFNNYNYMTFKMISLVPFEEKLIDFTLFNNKQLQWYNEYNQRVRDEIGPREGLSAEGKEWMMKNTNPIKFTFEVELPDPVGNGVMKAAPCVVTILAMLLSTLYSIL